jgi:hypothetical protein
VDRRQFSGFLDLMGYGYAHDESKKKLYYEGVMGSKPLYALTMLESMPIGGTDHLGHPYRGDIDYKISLRFEGKYYQARYRNVESHLGQTFIEEKTKVVWQC